MFIFLCVCVESRIDVDKMARRAKTLGQADEMAKSALRQLCLCGADIISAPSFTGVTDITMGQSTTID